MTDFASKDTELTLVAFSPASVPLPRLRREDACDSVSSALDASFLLSSACEDEGVLFAEASPPEQPAMTLVASRAAANNAHKTLFFIINLLLIWFSNKKPYLLYRKPSSLSIKTEKKSKRPEF